MFDTLLIANRGAIACRILRTLRAMQVKGVAVYAEADLSSLHVREADEALSLGEGPAAQTYLVVEKIIAAALQSGARAIHPGYGFLSENAAFAEACEAAGLAFVGPTPQQLRTFGLKHTARALAKAEGVPLLEGSELLADSEEACQAAGLRFYCPDFRFCTDNAAMIGCAGHYALLGGRRSSLALNGMPALALDAHPA